MTDRPPAAGRLSLVRFAQFAFGVLVAVVVPVSVDAAEATVEVQALDAPPERLVYQPPVFPPALAATASAEDVKVTLVIGPDGAVRRVEDVNASRPEFAAAAQAAVSRWQFQPGYVGGVATAYRVPVIVALRAAQSGPGLDANGAAGEFSEPSVEVAMPPAYPTELAGELRDGMAVVNLVVDALGTPSDAVVEYASHPAFAAPAKDAALTWRFNAAEREGRLVTARTHAVVRFRKDDLGLSAADRGRLAQLAQARDYDVAPEVAVQVPLAYPYEALLERQRSLVSLNLLISPEGQVEHIVPDAGSANEFGLAAAACVSCWTFQPATKYEQPVYGWIKWQLVFGDESAELQLDDAARDMLEALRNGRLQLTPGRELDKPLTPRERVTLKLPPDTVGASIAGDVVIGVIVDGQGRVRFPRIVKAPTPEVGYAAATAALRWRFDPPRKSGEPVSVRVQIPFRIMASTPAAP